MIQNSIQNDKFLRFIKILIFSFPIILISGNFFTNGLVLICFIAFFYILFKYDQYKIFNNRKIYYILIFFLYLILSSLFSKNNFSIINSFEYLRFLFFFLILYFFFKSDKKFIKKFFSYYIFFLSIIIFDGFFQYFNGFNLMGQVQIKPHRVSGLFGDELILGSFLSKYFFFLIIIFLYKKNKIVLISFGTLMILLTFVSGERAAFISLILLTILYLFRIFQIKKILLYFLILIFSFTVIVKLDPVVKERMILNTISNLKIIDNLKNIKSFNFISKTHNSHFQSAYLMYSKGSFKDQLLGRGVKSFRTNCSKPQFCDTPGGCCATHPHNIFFQIISELGLIGLFFYFYFYLHIFVAVFKSLLSNSIFTPKNALEITLLVILFPLITYGNIFGTFLSFNFYLILSYYIAASDNG